MRNVLKIDIDNTFTLLDLDAPEGSLKVLQTAVGGHIERVQLANGKIDMWINEEGLYVYTPDQVNPFASRLQALAYGQGHIRGPVVLTGGVDAEGETRALSSADLYIFEFLLK